MSADQHARTATLARPKTASASRSGHRRRAKPGDLEALRRELWHGIRKVSDALDDPDLDLGDLVRILNALAAVGNAYRGVTESSDLERRLAAVEAAQAADREPRP